MTDRPADVLSRRAFLAGVTAGGVAAFLAACGPSSGSMGTVPPSASGSPSVLPSPSPASAPPSATPSATPGRSASPSPGPSLEERIAGLLIVGFRGADLKDADWVRIALANRGLGGVILFDRDQLTGAARNVVSPAQVRRLTADLRAAAGSRPILVGVDQEGGVVTRLSPAHGFPVVASEASIGARTSAEAKTWADALAATLATNGFNLNFAPVVDLDVNPASPAIGALDRSFSPDPEVVVDRATIEIEAHRAAGVLTTLKHFPGIGSSTTNTDFGVADVTTTWRPIELEPFRRLIAAAHADLVMAGHVVNGQLDPDRPASLSKPTVDGVLRGQFGWDSVVVTDDLQAAAITTAFGADEAVLLALEAGDDLLLFANQQVVEPRVVSRVVGVVADAVAAGRLDRARIDEAYERVQRLLATTTAARPGLA
jgi:beta-N-acetylhexosaminidase